MGRERELPALLISRLRFNRRMSSCQVDGPGATPGSRTNSSQAARQHAAESPKLRSLRAARRQPAIFIWGRGRQAMHLLCMQVDVGALPTDSTNFNCGENEIQVSLISFASVGATPTPATIFGK